MASDPCIDLEKELAAIVAEPYHDTEKAPFVVDNGGFDGWIQARLWLAKSDITSPAEMFQFLEHARLQTNRPPHATIETILGRLCTLDNYVEAARWWDRLRAGGVLTRDGVIWGVRVLVRADRLGDALEICDVVSSMNRKIVAAGWTFDVGSQFRTPIGTLSFGDNPSPLQFLRCIPALFQAVQRSYRPDLMFILFDNIELLYGARVNPKVLDSLINSADWAAAFVGGDVPVRPTKRELTQHYAPTRFPTRQAALRAVLAMSAHPPTLENSTTWRGTHAALVCRHIFYAALQKHHPRLASLPSPLPASRHPSPLAHDFAARENVPTKSAFCVGFTMWENHMHLLVRLRLVHEIPFLLAWIRALDVDPNPATLGFAHAAVLRYMGRGAFDALVAWSKRWRGERWTVGKGISHWCERVDKVGKRRYQFRPKVEDRENRGWEGRGNGLGRGGGSVSKIGRRGGRARAPLLELP